MSNVFLTDGRRDYKTAIMLEKALVYDIGDGIAYTDGEKVVLNTEDNLIKLLPEYNEDFLKWLLWHERFHMELAHHRRYFQFEYNVQPEKYNCLTKQEVNIIMDILVHDSLRKMFPELIPIAETNGAQMRDRNSLFYTFTTYTLEEMLTEYAEFKSGQTSSSQEQSPSSKSSPDKSPDTSEQTEEAQSQSQSSPDKSQSPSEQPSQAQSQSPSEQDGSSQSQSQSQSQAQAPSPSEQLSQPSEQPGKQQGRHNETDWSKMPQKVKEFIDAYDMNTITNAVNRLKHSKVMLGEITQKLSGLATARRYRTYRAYNPIKLENGLVLKGRKPGKAELYLCFDASGSMSGMMYLFKEIITKSVPQALTVPCEWFTKEYGKGVYKDFMDVRARSGYNDDGDRTIELCYEAERKGYSPIGITDGGGQLESSIPHLKQLKNTIIVTPSKWWAGKVREVNKHITIITVND